MMTGLNGKSHGRETLLDEVVVAYLEAVEQGEEPDGREWQARYPELASDLVDFFADHESVNRLTAPLRKAAAIAPQRVEDPNSTVEYRPSPLLPTKIGASGDYLLLDEIPRGGMGVVYLARQVSLNRMVAVKMILSGYMASQTEIQRFHAEARAAAHLDHPNIVPIYEVGEFEGQPFFSMKVLEGGSLVDHLDDMRERPREAAGLIVKVAHAVHHAHQRGILHRDLKPGNVLLDRAGEPYVSDFGLSKRMEDGTNSGVVVGTPGYIAPEQAAGAERPTTAADVYSLGAVLYALLTGKPPFAGENRLEILKQVAEQPPVRPRTLNPLVDRDLETICLKCLEKSPAHRYPSAGALEEDLRRYLAGEPIQARPASLWVRGLKWAKRRPAPAALLLVVLTTLLGAIIGYVRYQEDRAAAAERALNERRRTDSLRLEVQKLVLKGQESMSAGRWRDARMHLASARALLSTEAALADLKDPVDHLLQTNDRRLEKEVAGQQAVSKYQRFMELRGHALFEGTLVTGATVPAGGKKIRRTVQEALGLFDVSEATGGGAIFEPSFTTKERKDVTEGCYELLLILADSVARDNPHGWKQGLRILERANALGLESKAYHFQRARYLERLGDTQGATDARARGARLQAGGALDSFLMGEELHRQGKVLAAIGAFRNALRLRPDHFWARYFLSVCYLRLDPPRPDLASDSLTACLGQGRDIAWVYLLRGVAQGQMDLIGPAEDDFQKVLEHTSDADARYAVFVNRGVLLGRQKKLDRAAADLKQAIALKPRAYQAYANLAKLYQQQKHTAAALEQMDRAVAAGCELVKARLVERETLASLYRNRALLQADRKDSSAAVEDLRHAIALDPRAEDHAACGRILCIIGSVQEALDAYQAALEATPHLAEAHRGRAETYGKLSDWNQVVLSLDQYLKRPGPAAGANALAEAYRARGQARVKLGQCPDAIADFTLALSHQAEALTHTHRGWAYITCNAPHLALPDFEKAIQLDGNYGEAYLGRGAVRVALAVTRGHLREAVADAESALSRGPKNDPRLLCKAARIYALAAAKMEGERDFLGAKMGEQYREQARRLLREALKGTPAAERAAFVRKSIQADTVLSRFAGAVNSE
jgi:tetratricopeptide (TPR) repeat protein